MAEWMQQIPTIYDDKIASMEHEAGYFKDRLLRMAEGFREGSASRDPEIERLRECVELGLQGLRTAAIVTNNKDLFAHSIAALEAGVKGE